ncbi:MAG TPA: hypothetical protein DEB12_07735 [Porphyromonadaceae bacterium]|jgi:glycosyltransferase involved in cell wall biosynthesis|nr:hypothetical protein [Porphyromonadaceae bacterium]
MKKKILLIHHGVGYGGGLIALLGLIKELQEEYEVTVYCIFKSEAVDYIKETGANIVSPKNRIFYKYFYVILVHSSASYNIPIMFIYKLYASLMYLINKYYVSKMELKTIMKSVDIVYLNSTFLSDWAYYPSKCLIKTVIHVREPLKNNRHSLFYYLISRNINKYCNLIIAITKDNAERVNLINKTTIIYDPIVEQRSSANILNQNKKLYDNKYKYFVYLGGSSRIKGYEQMVSALKYLDSNIRVFFLGTYDNNFGSLIQFVKAILNPYKLKKIKLYNKIKESENSVIIGKTHDVFYYYEKSVATISPFSKPHASLPILESFSVGTPVIVSDVKGMDEFVVDKLNGVFFHNSDAKDLANKINEMSKLSEHQIRQYKLKSKETYAKITSNRSSINECIEVILKEKANQI